MRFFNPYPGKPSRPQQTGLFLLDPSAALKLSGMTLRKIYSEALGEAFYKRYERFLAGKQHGAQRILEELASLMSKENPLAGDMAAAVAGNTEVQRRLGSIGPWKALSIGFHVNNPEPRLALRLLVSVEERSVGPIKLMHDGRFVEAAAVSQADPLMRHYLWPGVTSQLEDATDFSQIANARSSICFDVHLSSLAGLDVHRHLLGLKDDVALPDLLPSAEEPTQNPTSRFFKWVQMQTGTRSISALADRTAQDGMHIDETTLKRWSSGVSTPSHSHMRTIARHLFHDEEHTGFWARYWMARHLSFLGFYCQGHSRHAIRLRTETGKDSLLPWPSFPFGYATFGDWSKARVAFWTRHLMENHKELLPDATPHDALHN